MRFCLLSSGSRGNALLVTSPTVKILIDAGLSFRELQRRAASVGESLRDLDAVFVTHEHRDHVAGIGVVGRKLGAPVYMTPGTAAGLPPMVGQLPNVELFDAGDAVSINGMKLVSFPVSHDAADPVGFVVECAGAKLGIAADFGHASHLVHTRLARSHALILEANHCPEMLRRGPYPPALQQRVRSRHGHLSNPAMQALLGKLVHDALQVVVLAHISEKNNTPALAQETAAAVLINHPAKLYVSRQDTSTPVFEIEP